MELLDGALNRECPPLGLPICMKTMGYGDRDKRNELDKVDTKDQGSQTNSLGEDTVGLIQ